MSDVAVAALVLVLVVGLSAASVAAGVLLIRLLGRLGAAPPVQRGVLPLPQRDDDDEEIAARYHS